MTLPQICCASTACQPSPCPPYCIPPPPCVPSIYLPPICLPYSTPCVSAPPQICCPAPACPQYSCPPCRPPPSACCPPPPCNRQICCPQSSSCMGGRNNSCGGGGRNNCCSSGTKPIVYIPIRAPGQSCCRSTGGGNNTKKPRTNSNSIDQQASYNNCNFYLTQIPKALRDKFCLNEDAAADDDGEATEEDPTASETYTEETEECTSLEEEECAEDKMNGNSGAGCMPASMDCAQMFNPWAACFPQLANCFNPCGGYPFGMCGAGLTGGFGGKGPGMGGVGNRGGRGGGGPFDSSGRRGGGSFGSTGRGGAYGPGGRGGAYGPGGRGGAFGPEGRGGGRDGSYYPGGQGGRGFDNSSRRLGDDEKYNGSRRYQDGVDGPDSGRVFKGNKSEHASKSGLGTYKRGATSKIFSKTSGYRPYSYSTAELSKKPSAYVSKPCSVVSTNHAQTSTTKTAVQPTSQFNTIATGPSRSMVPERQTSRVGASRSAMMLRQQSGVNNANATKMPAYNGGARGTRSEPDFRQGANEGDEGTLLPVYRTTTQTRLQIIERPDEPSEIRVIQRPVQEVVSYQRIQPNTQHSNVNLNIVTDDLTKGKRKKRPFDPCHPPRTCLKYHTRRLHRLCSFSNRRKRRLSQIHKPLFALKQPPCPIRETVASILRKVPPGRCKFHEQEFPAFHEFCRTDDCPDTNRYPLLTRELSPLCHDYEEQQHTAISNAPNPHHRVETRGAKRKLHHR